MKQKYDLLILGATALGIAAANAHSDKAVAVIEAGCTCAREFSAALHGTLMSDCKNAMADELIGRGAVTDGEIWLPAVAPVAASLMKQSGADCYFFSAVADIRYTDIYEVDFVCYGVKYTICSDSLLDTTTDFISHAWFGRQYPSMKISTLNCITPDRKLHTYSDTNTASCNIAGARLKLLSDLPANIGEDKVTLIASELAMVPAESGWNGIWVPSAACCDAAAAYEKGLSVGIPAAVRTKSPAVTDDGSWDLIVVGFGTAGSIAALTAAKEGLRVLAIESIGLPGGTSTAGGITPYYFGFKGGVYCEIDKAAMKESVFPDTHGVGCGQRAKVLDEAVQLLNVDVRYNAAFTEAITDDRRVVGVRWTQNGEIYEAAAKMVIDCTAEASVCVSAGCEMLGGRQFDGAYQPFSSVYFNFAKNGGLGFGFYDTGVVDPYDADDYGRQLLTAQCCYVHLHSNYADHEYLGTAPLIGLREGRKIVGEETISFESLISGDYPKKPVYYGRSNLDNHGKDSAFEDSIYHDWHTIAGLWGWGVSIPVPMGALIPKGWDGLLAAGRNVSVEHNLAMGLRMKDDASKSGEAAARLAVMALTENIPAKDADVDKLREQLFTTECLKPSDIMLLEHQTNVAFYKEPWWSDDDTLLCEQLASDSPGYAIWSAKVYRKTALLDELLKSEDTNTRWHSALALALLGEHNAVDVLIEAAYSRDGFIPKSSRMYVNLRSVSAIAALGRLADAKAAEPLLALLEDLDFTESLTPSIINLMCDKADVRFQYESHLIVSLCSIAKANPALRELIKSRLETYINGRTFCVSMMGTAISFKRDCTDTIRKYVDQL